MSYQFGINQLQNTTVPNAKYKTILCRHYQATKQCAIGSKCQFAHGIEEQRQMNDPLPASALSSITTAPQTTTLEQQQKNQSPLFKIPCKYHQLNFCKNGSGCQYVHDSEGQMQPSQQQLQQQQQQIQLLQQQQQQQQIQQQQQQQQQQIQPQQSVDPMAVTLNYILMEMQQIFVQEDLMQKIRFATEQVRQGNFVLACDQIRTIINSSDRTVDEIQQYTLLYNQSVAYYKQLLQQ